MTWVELGAAAIGACVGSFLNVVIHRLPQQDPAQRSLGGRSRCPHCGVQIRWQDNLPVLGWLKLLGRARCCGARIPFRYPLVEALTALLFVVVAHWPPFGPVLGATAVGEPGHAVLLWRPTLALLLHFYFVATLVACTFIDLDHRLLPDALTKPGIAVGVAGSLVVPGFAGSLGDPGGGSLVIASVLASLVGALVGAGSVYAIREVGGRVFRREAMGFGDVKFLGMIGAFLGWKGALLALLLGCVSGALIGFLQLVASAGARQKIPFGPYLALGALGAMLAEQPILVFLFETWPEWQRSVPAAPWLMAGLALLSLLALIALVRRARGQG